MNKYSYFEIYPLFEGFGFWLANSLDEYAELCNFGERLTAEEIGQCLGGN